MISTRIALIIAAAAFAAGSFLAPPVQQAIAAVIATDVQCTGCVGTSDVAGNAITAAKIKDNEVKAAEIATNAVGSSEIATDAVGAAELQGVTKLLFQECAITTEVASFTYGPGILLGYLCTVAGADSDDFAIATWRAAGTCFDVSSVEPGEGAVRVWLRNECPVNSQPGMNSISIMVFDK